MENKIEIYKSKDNQIELQVQMDTDTVWLTQEQMEYLFQTTKQNISLHINNVFSEKELDKNSTVKESLTVRKEGKRQVKRKIQYYNPDVIISVGYRVKSQRGTQFRQWATQYQLYVKTTSCHLTNQIIGNFSVLLPFYSFL